MLGNSAVAQFAVAQFPTGNNLIALVGRCVTSLRGKIIPNVSANLSAHGLALARLSSDISLPEYIFGSLKIGTVLRPAIVGLTALSAKTISQSVGRLNPTATTGLSGHTATKLALRDGLLSNVSLAGTIKTKLRGSGLAEFTVAFIGRVRSGFSAKLSPSLATSLAGRAKLLTNTTFQPLFVVALSGYVKTATKVHATANFIAVLIARLSSALKMDGNQNYATALSGYIRTAAHNRILPPIANTALSGIVKLSNSIRSSSYLAVPLAGLVRLLTRLESAIRALNTVNAINVTGEASKNLPPS